MSFHSRLFFSGNLSGCQLLLAELPFQQELVQQTVTEADGYMLLREVRACGVGHFIKPSAGIMLAQRKQRMHDVLSGIKSRFVEGTEIHIMPLKSFTGAVFEKVSCWL